MFDLRRMLMAGAMAPALGYDRQAIMSVQSMLPIFAMPPTYPRYSRSGGYRAHQRWKRRRAAGRA